MLTNYTRGGPLGWIFLRCTPRAYPKLSLLLKQPTRGRRVPYCGPVTWCARVGENMLVGQVRLPIGGVVLS